MNTLLFTSAVLKDNHFGKKVHPETLRSHKICSSIALVVRFPRELEFDWNELEFDLNELESDLNEPSSLT